jgi:hypothetical protein
MSSDTDAVAGGTPQGDDADALRARLTAIEEQPLDQRADDYAQLHAQLQGLLEGADTRDNRG